MAIDPETRNRIRRMYYADHQTINSINSSTGIHPDAIKRALNYNSFHKTSITPTSYWDQYKHVIEEKLKDHPKMAATRMHQILKDRGATLTASSLRVYMRTIRPKIKEAFIKRSPLKGDEAQVDWAHFGEVQVGSANRKLYCFLMVLSWSRKLYVEFVLDLKTETFFNCHANAFEYFGGVPRTILYDNLKSVVVERTGINIRFNQQAMDFSGHYCFELRVCNPYRGNEKGIVERKVRFLRDNFFEGRIITSLDVLNQEVLIWLESTANQYPWPPNRDKTIAEQFEIEKENLIQLPSGRLTMEISKMVKAGKYPYIQFDLNRYSIPSEYVQRSLLLQATHEQVRIYCENQLIATHQRFWGRNEEVFNQEHFDRLNKRKSMNSPEVFKNELLRMYPELAEIISFNIQSGLSIRRTTKRLQSLLDDYGTRLFESTLKEFLTTSRLSIDAFEMHLRRLHEANNNPVQIKLNLPNKPDVKNLHITSHNLANYDELF